MRDAIPVRRLLSLLLESPSLDLTGGKKLVILSDLHMGNGGRADDLVKNDSLVSDVLEKWYLNQGWVLALNGDVEELQRFPLQQIRRRWQHLYTLFDRFAARDGLYKLLGNHDEDLRLRSDYPYPLIDGLRIETGGQPVFLFHGHQSSGGYVRYSTMSLVFLRYLLNPLGIHNISASRSPRKRFAVERRAYEFSQTEGLISIIGHTHRSLFESLSRFDHIKFELESLCRRYPEAGGDERAGIAHEVRELREELAKLKRKERRSSLKDSLYGDELPIPCLFNSGSCIGKKGISVLELDAERISLVYWFVEGNSKRFVTRGEYAVESLPGTNCRRAVLNSERLDYIEARIALLS